MTNENLKKYFDAPWNEGTKSAACREAKISIRTLNDALNGTGKLSKKTKSKLLEFFNKQASYSIDAAKLLSDEA